MNEIEKILRIINSELKRYQWNVYNEKILQEQLFDSILKNLGFVREYKLDGRSIIDFYHPELSLGIEVKIKGQVSSIYRQCKRYAKNKNISHLTLLTSVAMNLPKEVEGVPTSILRIGTTWL